MSCWLGSISSVFLLSVRSLRDGDGGNMVYGDGDVGNLRLFEAVLACSRSSPKVDIWRAAEDWAKIVADAHYTPT